MRPRLVDEKLTYEARVRQARGIGALRKLFGCDRLKKVMDFDTPVDTRPVRLRPHVPPLRDPEHKAKHRARVAVKRSRKRNRRRTNTLWRNRGGL